MKRSFYQNAQKPEGALGKLMMNKMNLGHARLAAWGFEHMDIEPHFHAIDLGCGGGANIATMLEKCTEGSVTGIDYSDVSVDVSKEKNKEAIDQGRCKVLQADVSDLPFDQEEFDHATAFETVFFWPDIQKGFKEVLRILKKGAKFAICNEMSSETSSEEWHEKIKGLFLYTTEEMVDHLVQAGFKDVQVFKDEEEGWIMFLSEK